MLADVDRFIAVSAYTKATEDAYRYHLARLAKWLVACRLDPAVLPAALLSSYLKSQQWSNNTIRAAGNAARSFFKWRYGSLHPALELKLPHDDAGPGRSLEAAQVEQLLAVFDSSSPAGWRNLAMLGLMVETGIREAEICRLEMRHLDLRRRHFDVLAKRERWREGIFSSLTAQYLDVWLNVRPTIAVRGCPYVFVSVNGKTKGRALTPGGLRANFRKYGLRSEIGALSPHDLRRTMATLLTESGAPSRLVQELGAWSDIRMVERYTRRLRADQIEQYSPLIKSYGIKKVTS